MARFDVHRSRATGTLLIDVQAEVLRHLDTRIMTPLLASDAALPPGLPRLNPRFEIDDEPYVMATHLTGATARNDLGPRISSLEDQGYEIQSALDLLLTGV